jgi:hypothetical protein
MQVLSKIKIVDFKIAYKNLVLLLDRENPKNNQTYKLKITVLLLLV